MSQLAELLNEYFKRSSYRQIKELAQAAQIYGTVSESYVRHIMRGLRQNPAQDKLLAIARALNLSQAETEHLLEVAGLAQESAVSPRPEIQSVVIALNKLAETPGVPPEAVKMIVDGVVLAAQGIILGVQPAGEVKPAPPEAPLLKALPAVALSPEEGLIDDLLGEIIARDEDHPLDALFSSLEQITRSEQWEAKRRIAEALPRLVKLQPEATLRLAGILRGDYHPDYRADIRRRVIEALPALYPYRPQETLELLAYREQDEVYMAMATVEALHALQRAGRIESGVTVQYFEGLRLDEPLHREVIDFLRQLLAEAISAPDAALQRMNEQRRHPERIFRIAILRAAPQLLASRPEEALDLFFYFLRRDENDKPEEHQNLRRPVSRALPEILDLLPDAPAQRREKIGRLLDLLARDPDIHVRRALADRLDRLVGLELELAVAVMEVMLEDEDPYVRQRTWRVLLHLAEVYPDRADRFYGRLLTKNSLP